MRVERRAALSAAMLLGAAIVVWNVVFDHGINQATERYLALQQEHAAGRRPFVRIQEIMRPAAVESAWRATAWTAAVLITGLLVVTRVFTSSRESRR